MGNEGDKSLSGTLYLFDPSNTTYATLFQLQTNSIHDEDICAGVHVAGYVNITAAITAVKFTAAADDFDGLISLYGVK